MTGEDRELRANGLRFHYLEWGAAGAHPLFLLHGFGNEAHIWDIFAPSIADRYRVYALDWRGHGDSEWASEYGAAHNVADLQAITAALGVERLTVVGFSMGGLASMLFASDEPNRLEKLVLVDVGPAGSPQGSQRLRATVAQARARFDSRDEALAYIKLANPRRSEALIRASLEHAFRALPDGGYELKSDPRLRETFGSQPRPSADELWERLARITCPTLIVRGGESPQLAPEVADRMVEVLPDARLEVVPGAGHTVMMDNPDGFNAVVGSFL